MSNLGIAGIALIIANLIVSYKGLNDSIFFRRYMFHVGSVLNLKQYERFITSGFLHGSWMHLAMNMLALYFFGFMEFELGTSYFLLLYFGSMIGGDLFAMYMYRNHPDYSSIGASGAVSGVVFAAIALIPGIKLGLIFLPIFLPAWVFGLLYVLYSIYGIRTKRDNIGHEAHLGGGLVGMLIAILYNPMCLRDNPIPIFAIIIPSIIFLYFTIAKPDWNPFKNTLLSTKRRLTPDEAYNEKQHKRQLNIDEILDKIGEKGFNSLTPDEKKMLDQYSEGNRASDE